MNSFPKVLLGRAQMIVLKILGIFRFSAFFSIFSAFFLRISRNFCEIQRIPLILYICSRFRKKSVKFAAKNNRFNEKSAIFIKNADNFPKFCKITRKSAKFRKFTWSIMQISKNPEKCAYSRYRSCPYKRERTVFCRKNGKIEYWTLVRIGLKKWNETPQILRGSFSAVSTATIARKDAFFRIFQDLQDSHAFAPLQIQN